MASVLESRIIDPRIVAFVIRVSSRRLEVGFGRAERERAIKVACRGKVCGPRSFVFVFFLECPDFYWEQIQGSTREGLVAQRGRSRLAEPHPELLSIYLKALLTKVKERKKERAPQSNPSNDHFPTRKRSSSKLIF